MMLAQDGLVLPVLRLLAACIGAMLVTSCLTLLFRPALIGWGGEMTVRQALARRGLPALHDVVLADTLGHAQIDHLVRTAQGIVVIETKAFAGWITGTLYSMQWVQHLAGSRIRHGFQNPARQNHRHCKAVEVATSGLAVQVHSLVVASWHIDAVGGRPPHLAKNLNVRQKPPLIARRGVPRCAPLHLGP